MNMQVGSRARRHASSSSPFFEKSSTARLTISGEACPCAGLVLTLVLALVLAAMPVVCSQFLRVLSKFPSLVAEFFLVPSAIFVSHAHSHTRAHTLTLTLTHSHPRLHSHSLTLNKLVCLFLFLFEKWRLPQFKFPGCFRNNPQTCQR